MKQVVKTVYRSLPFKRQAFSLLKSVWHPDESIYKHLYFDQWFWVRIDRTRKFRLYNGTIIENEIFWKGLLGGWEKESLRIWIQLVKSASVVFDIGANSGVYALIASAVSPDSSVYAFEPHPLFFRTLQRNIELNHYPITAVQRAVSRVDGNIRIEDYSGSSPSIQVPAVTLKRFIEDRKISGVQLMKIDVESFEAEVLEGLGEYLRMFRPSLILEILNDEVADRISKLITGLDYLMFDIDEEKGPIPVDRLRKSSSFNYLLCTREVAASIHLI